MFLAMHGLSRSAQTAGQVLGSALEIIRTNDGWGSNRQMTKEKSWTLQLLLNQPVKYMASMFEKELKTYYWRLNLSCLHMVLEEKSTAHKFLSFQ